MERQTAAARAEMWLLRRRTENADMIELLRRGFARDIWIREEGVLLRCGEEGLYMLAAETGRAADALLAQAEDVRQIVAHGEAALEAARRRISVSETTACIQAVYWEKTPPSVPDIGLSVRPIGEEYTEAVLAHYHLATDGEYVRGRVASGEMLGGFFGETLAGFIGAHAEGSVGMLEVLPKFRRRGVGLTLECAAIARGLARGQTPYCQVIVGNEPSFALQRRLGMTLAEQPLFWLS